MPKTIDELTREELDELIFTMVDNNDENTLGVLLSYRIQKFGGVPDREAYLLRNKLRGDCND